MGLEPDGPPSPHPSNHPSQKSSIDGVKGSARKDAVARVEPGRHLFSVPDDRALQLGSGAEFGTRARCYRTGCACAR